MELSVVIPTVRPKADIEVLAALSQCPFEDYEVIVRDDVPVSRARNEGYRRAAAEKIVFLDDDSMPRPGYLSEAAQTLSEEAAVAGRTVHPRTDVFAGQLTSHYDFGTRPRYVDRFWGCNMGLRRGVLDAVGGWDEQMGWGHEEKELADRVTAEYDILYNPEMVVDHVYADSLWDYWNKQYHLEKATPYYLRQRGHSGVETLARTGRELLDPRSYLRGSVAETAAETGATVAGAAGRVVGLFQNRAGAVEGGPVRN